jgi:hypothetical protein
MGYAKQEIAAANARASARLAKTPPLPQRVMTAALAASSSISAAACLSPSRPMTRRGLNLRHRHS